MIKKWLIFSFALLTIPLYSTIGFLSSCISREENISHIERLKEYGVNNAIIRGHNILTFNFLNFVPVTYYGPFVPGWMAYMYTLPYTYCHFDSASWLGRPLHAFEDFQIGAIQSITDNELNACYQTNIFSDENVLNQYEYYFNNIKANFFRGWIEVDDAPSYCIPDSRLLDTSTCRMPQAYDEIAITNFQANLLLHFGLRNPYKTFLSIDDIIGQQYGGFTIVGIYETCDYQKEIDLCTEGKTIDDDIDYFFLFSYLKKGYHNERLNQGSNSKVTYTNFVIDTRIDIDKYIKLFESCKAIHHNGRECSVEVISPFTYQMKENYKNLAPDIYNTIVWSFGFTFPILVLSFIVCLIAYGKNKKNKYKIFSYKKETINLTILSIVGLLFAIGISTLISFILVVSMPHLSTLGITFCIRSFFSICIIASITQLLLTLCILLKRKIWHVYIVNRENNKNNLN